MMQCITCERSLPTGMIQWPPIANCFNNDSGISGAPAVDNPLKWCKFCPTYGSISKSTLDRLIRVEIFEHSSGFIVEFKMTFYRKDFNTHLSENRRLISGTGSYFKYRITGLDLQQFSHSGNSKWL